jgi:hypothetical protein
MIVIQVYNMRKKEGFYNNEEEKEEEKEEKGKRRGYLNLFSFQTPTPRPLKVPKDGKQDKVQRYNASHDIRGAVQLRFTG